MVVTGRTGTRAPIGWWLCCGSTIRLVVGELEGEVLEVDCAEPMVSREGNWGFQSFAWPLEEEGGIEI
jgi:hypothetical protein